MVKNFGQTTGNISQKGNSIVKCWACNREVYEEEIYTDFYYCYYCCTNHSIEQPRLTECDNKGQDVECWNCKQLTDAFLAVNPDRKGVAKCGACIDEMQKNGYVFIDFPYQPERSKREDLTTISPLPEKTERWLVERMFR